MKVSHPSILSFLVSGCSSVRGHVDFIRAPEHEWHIGSWEVLVYPSQTAIRIGDTYYFLDISFYLLVCGFITLAVLGIAARKFHRRPRHEDAR
jgi:hypothetical protein